MANKDMGRKSQTEDRDVIENDDLVRGRADEMEDKSTDSDEFEDTEDLDDEEEEQGEGSF